jgi:hypothetical protein
MIKSINTKEERCFINIESQYRGSTTIWFVDDLFDIKKKLATYQDGKWGFSSPNRMNDLIQLMKHNPHLKRELKSCLDYMGGYEPSNITISWNCFKRKLKIKLKKLVRKIKNNIEF